ncbi:MAG: SIMPL domain-containing protein, partial [Desulfosarcina sp.]
MQPDIATAQIGVDVSGPTASAASAEAARIMEAILATLEAQGVASKDIQTSNYSIFAERPGDPLTGRPGEQVTYRVNNGVAVTIRDLTTVGALLDAVIDAGANNIYGVNFGVDDPDEVMAEARSKPAEDALARAEELAGL